MDRREEWRSRLGFGFCLFVAAMIAWAAWNIAGKADELAKERHRATARAQLYTGGLGGCGQAQQLAYLLEGEFRRIDTRLDNLEGVLGALFQAEERLLRHFKLPLVPIFPLRRPDPANPDPWQLAECPAEP